MTTVNAGGGISRGTEGLTKQTVLGSPELRQGRRVNATAVSAVFVLCIAEGFQFDRLSVKSSS